MECGAVQFGTYLMPLYKGLFMGIVANLGRIKGQPEDFRNLCEFSYSNTATYELTSNRHISLRAGPRNLCSSNSVII